MKNRCISRRVTLLGGTSLVVGAAGIPKSGEAQSLSDLRNSVIELFERAQEWLSDAVSAFVALFTEGDSPQVGPAADALQACRSELSEAGVSTAPRELSRIEHIDMVDAFLEHDVSPDPLEYELNLLETGTESDGETFEDVLVDIFLESLGIDRLARGEFLRVIAQLELQQDIERIEQSIKQNDWSRVERLLRRFARKLFGRAGLKEFASALERPTYRRLLIGLSARAIPFAGWALFAVSLGIAIYNNRERLQAL